MKNKKLDLEENFHLKRKHKNNNKLIKFFSSCPEVIIIIYLKKSPCNKFCQLNYYNLERTCALNDLRSKLKSAVMV